MKLTSLLSSSSTTSSSLFFWIACFCSHVVCLINAEANVNGDHRHLVVFAGPHKTSETSVEEFFATYANGGRTEDADVDDALEGWIWPQVPVDNDILIRNFHIKPHQVFEHLVMDVDDDDIQEELLNIIASEYQEYGTNGIIIGSEEFDRVGRTPFTHANAIDAVVRVKDRLGISEHHVDIVLLYKTPRIDQWLAIFNFEYLEMQNHEDAYEEFLCDAASTNERWETLQTAMNTLHVARTYRAQGWNVYLIDMDGVADAKKSVEHVIGCDILEANCDNHGYLQGLKGKTFDFNSNIYDSFGDRVFKSLSDLQEYDLENLFRSRDCNHIKIMEDEYIQVLYNKTMFMGCSQQQQDLIGALEDPDFMLDAVRSQKDCGTEPMNIRDVINGKTTVAAEDPEKLKHNHEEYENYGRQSNQNNKKHHRWFIPFMIFVLIGVAYWHRAEIGDRIDRTHQYGGMPFVIETPQMNSQRPLSVLT